LTQAEASVRTFGLGLWWLLGCEVCHLSLAFQAEFGAIVQTGAGIGSGVLTL